MILGYCAVSHAQRNNLSPEVELTVGRNLSSVVESCVARQPQCQKIPINGHHPSLGWNIKGVITSLTDAVTGDRDILFIVYEVTDEFDLHDKTARLIHEQVVKEIEAL